MSISRREFIQLFGVTVATMLVTRCKRLVPATPVVTCYAPIAPTLEPTAISQPLLALDRLRVCWMSFGVLAQVTVEAAGSGSSEVPYRFGLVSDHRQALDELVAAGELSASVADLVQEAYEAAVYHVWRSNAPITCYEPAFVDYAPASAQVLVDQSQVLRQLAEGGNIDPATLAKARSALDHDMAYYALSDTDVQTLYSQLAELYQGQSIPAFENVPLDSTPDAQAAAQFIIDLLTQK
jgi:hypothetical protein